MPRKFIFCFSFILFILIFFGFVVSAKQIDFKYVLDGKVGNISLNLSEKEYNSFSNFTRGSWNSKEEDSRKAFLFQEINDSHQKEILIPLVESIKNISNSSEDQIRIAISLVQNIPYGESDKTIEFYFIKIRYSRYPYETLYENQGVCDEKSALLVFLLRELNYSSGIFYYANENHEAVGIKCPEKYSLNKTGYCFVETTSPSIIGDNKGYYFDAGYLSENFSFYVVNDGNSLNKNMHEFKDFKKYNKLRQRVLENKYLNYFQDRNWKKLNKKYGLE